MKATKIMIAVVVVTLITWFLLGSLVYMLSDLSLKAALSSPGLFMFMIIFGWIPAVIVGTDLDESYE